MLTSIYLVRDHRTGVLDAVKAKAAEEAANQPAADTTLPAPPTSTVPASSPEKPAEAVPASPK